MDHAEHGICDGVRDILMDGPGRVVEGTTSDVRGIEERDEIGPEFSDFDKGLGVNNGGRKGPESIHSRGPVLVEGIDHGGVINDGNVVMTRNAPPCKPHFGVLDTVFASRFEKEDLGLGREFVDGSQEGLVCYGSLFGWILGDVVDVVVEENEVGFVGLSQDSNALQSLGGSRAVFGLVVPVALDVELGFYVGFPPALQASGPSAMQLIVSAGFSTAVSSCEGSAEREDRQTSVSVGELCQEGWVEFSADQSPLEHVRGQVVLLVKDAVVALLSQKGSMPLVQLGEPQVLAQVARKPGLGRTAVLPTPSISIDTSIDTSTNTSTSQLQILTRKEASETVGPQKRQHQHDARQSQQSQRDPSWAFTSFVPREAIDLGDLHDDTIVLLFLELSPVRGGQLLLLVRDHVV